MVCLLALFYLFFQFLLSNIDWSICIDEFQSAIFNHIFTHVFVFWLIQLLELSLLIATLIFSFIVPLYTRMLLTNSLYVTVNYGQSILNLWCHKQQSYTQEYSIRYLNNPDFTGIRGYAGWHRTNEECIWWMWKHLVTRISCSILCWQMSLLNPNELCEVLLMHLYTTWLTVIGITNQFSLRIIASCGPFSNILGDIIYIYIIR